jgi:hypothetical protein
MLSKAERKKKWILWNFSLVLGPFWVLGLCNGYGNVGPWVYPCLGPFCNV